MKADEVQKYLNKPIAKLLKIATEKFNAFIRERDKDLPCISCGSRSVLQAGHYYSGGHYPELRFNEFNVNGQCQSCNYFKSGNLLEYRKGLIQKIGIEEVEKLDFIVACNKKVPFKWDKFHIISVILQYK